MLEVHCIYVIPQVQAQFVESMLEVHCIYFIPQVQAQFVESMLEVHCIYVIPQVQAQFVESMLEVHSKYTEVIQMVFKGDQQFVGALDKACAAAINYKKNPKSVCKSPEWVSSIFFFRFKSKKVYSCKITAKHE